MKPNEFYEVMVSAQAVPIAEIDEVAAAIAGAFGADWFSKCGPADNVRIIFRTAMPRPPFGKLRAWATLALQLGSG